MKKAQDNSSPRQKATSFLIGLLKTPKATNEINYKRISEEVQSEREYLKKVTKIDRSKLTIPFSI